MNFDAATWAALNGCQAALGVAMGILSVDGTFIDADEQLCRMLGRTHEQVVGLHTSALVTTANRLVADQRIRLRREHREIQRPTEVSVVRGDGSTITIRSVAAPIDDDRWAVMWYDVSRVDEIRLHVEQLDNLIEHMPLGVVILDAEGVEDPMDMRLRSANPAAREAFQSQLDGRLGDRVIDIFPQSRSFDDAMRALLLIGSDRVEHFPDLIVGDRTAPTRVYTRDAVALPGDAVAFLLRDVTVERSEELRRRRLLERIVDTSDAERRELAMGVHDDSVQQIAAATMLVEALRRTPPTSGDDDRLAMMERSMRAAMASLRRLVFELSPPELVESGLEGALRSASDYLFVDTDTETCVSIDVLLDPDDPLDTPLETAAFRIAAEALANVRKHAHASHVDVCVSELAGSIELLVIDDGVGFDRAERPGHIGVRSMIERAASVGGTCWIDGRPWGTVVHAVLPRTGRGHGENNRTIDWEQAAGVSPRTELASMQLENESLREANRITMERATDARRHLDGVMSLWQVLGDRSRPVGELLDTTARDVAGILRDACAIRLVSADGSRLVRVASWHPDGDQLAYLDRHVGDSPLYEALPSSSVITHGRAVLVDAHQLRSALGGGVEPAPIEPRSALIVPLDHDGRLLGTLSVIRDRTQTQFQPDDERLLCMLADVVATQLGSLLSAPS